MSIKFYLGQNEDSRPGDSISENSEKLLQRDSGLRSVCDFSEGGVSAIKHLFYKRFPASREELKSSFSGLVYF